MKKLTIKVIQTVVATDGTTCFVHSIIQGSSSKSRSSISHIPHKTSSVLLCTVTAAFGTDPGCVFVVAGVPSPDLSTPSFFSFAVVVTPFISNVLCCTTTTKQECDYKHESFGGGAPIALYHLCNLYTSSKKTKNDTQKYHGVGSDEVTNGDPFS